jgi:hypothetical protein
MTRVRVWMLLSVLLLGCSLPMLAQQSAAAATAIVPPGKYAVTAITSPAQTLKTLVAFDTPTVPTLKMDLSSKALTGTSIEQLGEAGPPATARSSKSPPEAQ